MEGKYVAVGENQTNEGGGAGGIKEGDWDPEEAFVIRWLWLWCVGSLGF